MTRTRFTLVELLLVVAILSILAALLLPALNRARVSARSVYCMSNQKQVGTGYMLYATDHQGMIVPHWRGKDDK